MVIPFFLLFPTDDYHTEPLFFTQLVRLYPYMQPSQGNGSGYKERGMRVSLFFCTLRHVFGFVTNEE